MALDEGYGYNSGPTPKPRAKVKAPTSRKVMAPRKPQARTQPYSPPKRSTGNSPGGNKGTPPVKNPTVKKPGTPGLNDYLKGDSVYQDAVRGGKRTLNDYLSDLNRRRGEATTQYTDTSAGMERDRVQQLESLRNEFASRGLIQSGLYGEEQGRFQQQFTDQRNALSKQQTALIADLLGQETNFRREQELALEAAKQQALQRRAAKYNIGG